MRRLPTVIVTALLFHLPLVAQATMLNVNLAGVDVRFKGATTNLVDDGGDAFNGVAGTNAAIADPIDAATFKQGATLIDSWMAPLDIISFDMLIDDSLASLVPNVLTVVPITAPGVNEISIFIGDGTSIRLDVTSLSVQRIVLGVQGLNEIFLVTGSANVVSQSLPGGMAFDGPVGIAYVSTDAMFVNNSQGLAVTGVFTITGEMVVPEPESATVMVMFACLAVTGVWRRSMC